MCTGEFLSKFLSLQQSFVAATSRKISNWFDFLRLVGAKKSRSSPSSFKCRSFSCSEPGRRSAQNILIRQIVDYTPEHTYMMIDT